MSQCKIRAIVELTDVETSEWDGKVGSDICYWTYYLFLEYNTNLGRKK